MALTKKDDRKIIEKLENDIFFARRTLSAGDEWKHVRSGKKYHIVDIVVNESNLKLQVIYAAAGNPVIKWSRPLAEFMDGRFILVEKWHEK